MEFSILFDDYKDFYFFGCRRHAELPLPGIKFMSPALEVTSPNHWTTRETLQRPLSTENQILLSKCTDEKTGSELVRSSQSARTYVL